jgi:hypothetical protein
VPTFLVVGNVQNTLNANFSARKKLLIVGDSVNISKTSNSTSCKTNIGITEAGVVYKDKFEA